MPGYEGGPPNAAGGPTHARKQPRRRVLAVLSLGVGTLLWYAPLLVLPFLAAPIVGVLAGIGVIGRESGDFFAGFTVVLVLRWVAAAVLIAFVVLVERRRLLSIGFRRPALIMALTAVVVGLVFAVYNATVAYWLLADDQAVSQTERAIAALSLPALAHLVINAAVVEEIFFRGFLIERLTAATGRLWLAGIASFCVFVADHVTNYGSIVLALAITGPATLAYVLVYLRWRNLWVCIGIHAIGNAVVLLPT